MHGPRQAVLGKNKFKHFFRKLNNHKCIVSLRAYLHYINRKYEVKKISENTKMRNIPQDSLTNL